MKDDEKRFLIEVYKRCGQHLSPRDLINLPEFTMNYKRAWYLLDKWSDKGWYDYGVSLDLGWLTAEGKRQVKMIMKAQTNAETESNVSSNNA